MKLKTKKRFNKKYILAIVSVAALLCVTAVAYVYGFNGNIFGWTKHSTEKSAVDYSPATRDQKQAGEDTKANSVNNIDNDKPVTTGSDQPPAPIPQPNGKNKVEVTITAANQNGSLLQLRTLVLAVANTGTCTLTLSKDGKTVTKTSQVQSLANSATCQGFDVPVSELSPGNWQANLSFENETLTGAALKQILIQ